MKKIPVKEVIRDENRRAIVWLRPDEIRQLLGLPEDYIVEHVSGSFDPPGIQIVVESPDLEPQPRDVYLPSLAGHWFRALLVDDAGVVWTRWEWQPE